MYWKGIVVIIVLSITAWGCGRNGCTDPRAYNYDMAAKKDDGSCLYFPVDIKVAITDTINEDINNDITITGHTMICGSVRINAAVKVPAGITLVMCSHAGLIVESGGSLAMEGADGNPVRVIGAVASPGYWGGIRFRSNSSENKLIHVDIFHGGESADYEHGNVLLSDSATVTINNSTFGESGKYGIAAHAGTKLVDFEKNIFAANEGPSMLISAEHMGQLDQASTYKGNNNHGDEYIEVEGNKITVDQTWPAGDVPFYITGMIYIHSNITVTTGLEADFSKKGGISVANDGSFNAEATATSAIIFKGKNDKTWNGIRILSNHSANKLIFTQVYHGGGNVNFKYANLFLSENAMVLIQNSIFAEGTEYGIVAEEGCELAGFSQNIFLNNKKGALSIRSEHIGQLDEDSQYDGGNNQGDDLIRVEGNAVLPNHTWPGTDAPFYFTGYTELRGNVTVNPGFNAHFASNAALGVTASGSLKAVGTANNGISFKGKVQNKGYWSGICIMSNNANNEFEYVTVSHAGSYASYSYSNVFVRDGGSLIINNSEVSFSQNCGIALASGSATLPANPVISGNNVFVDNKTDVCN